MKPPTRLVAGLVTMVVLALAMLVGAETLGQERTVAPVAINHPAYIQTGTCDRPGDPVAALAMTATGNAGERPDGTPIPASPGLLPAAVSVTEIDTPLDELLRDELIVRVVESESRPDVDIACGAIGGLPDGDGNLYLTVSQRDDSGVTGIVWFQAEGNATTITLFLIPAIGESDATPAD